MIQGEDYIERARHNTQMAILHHLIDFAQGVDGALEQYRAGQQGEFFALLQIQLIADAAGKNINPLLEWLKQLNGVPIEEVTG